MADLTDTLKILSFGQAADVDQKAQTEEFRFLDLARELRDEVYRLLLTCNTSLRSPGNTAQPVDLDDCTVETPVFIEHQICVSLLRTCRQIKDEAEIVLTNNDFVRVSALNMGLEGHLFLRAAPVLAFGDSVKAFKHSRLQLHLRFHQGHQRRPTSPNLHFLTLACYLWELTQLIAERTTGALSRYLITKPRLLSTFGLNILFRPHVSVVKQIEYLKPFQDQLLGIRDQKLCGAWDVGVVSDVTAYASKGLPRFSIKDHMERVEAIKAIGNKHFEANQNVLAIRYWISAERRLNCMHCADVDHSLADPENTEVSIRAAELAFILLSNCGVAALKLARANFDDKPLMLKNLRSMAIYELESMYNVRYYQPWQTWSPSMMQEDRQAARGKALKQLRNSAPRHIRKRCEIPREYLTLL